MRRAAAALVLLPLLLAAAAGQPAPQRGAALEVTEFRYRRPIPEGPAGLAVLPLDAAALAHSRGPRGRFADVRIVDAAGQQIPYVLERAPEPWTLDLGLQPADTAIDVGAPPHGARSIYAVDLPHGGLPDPTLVLETSARVFRRPVRVGIERPPDRRHRTAWLDVLASTTWQHANPDEPAPPLELRIDTPPADSRRLLLVIDEGDNRPLPVAEARLRLPGWQLRFVRVPEPLWLLYGHERVAAPEYDLALLAPDLTGGVAQTVAAGAETDSRPPDGEVLPHWIFWTGLGLAVVVLLALIARLIATGTAPPPPPSPPAP